MGNTRETKFKNKKKKTTVNDQLGMDRSAGRRQYKKVKDRTTAEEEKNGEERVGAEKRRVLPSHTLTALTGSQDLTVVKHTLTLTQAHTFWAACQAQWLREENDHGGNHKVKWPRGPSSNTISDQMAGLMREPALGASRFWVLWDLETYFRPSVILKTHSDYELLSYT